MSESVNFEKFPTVAIVTLVVPTVINLLLFLIADSLGFIDNTVINPLTSQPIGLLDVFFLTFTSMVGIVVIFYILGKRIDRPVFYIRIIAILGYLAFLLNPTFLPNIPLEMLISLEIMHAAALIFVLGYMTTQGAS